MNPAKADRPLRRGWCSSLGLRQADLGQIIGEGRVLLCTEGRRVIFDSVVVSFVGRQSGDSRSLRIRNGDSQQTLNCALSVDLL